MSDQINAITSFLKNEINENRGLRSLLKQKADHYGKKIQLLTCAKILLCSLLLQSLKRPIYNLVEIETTSDFEDRYDLSLFEDLEFQATPTGSSGWNDEDFD